MTTTLQDRASVQWLTRPVPPNAAKILAEMVEAGIHPWVARAFIRRGVMSALEAKGGKSLLPFTGPLGLKGIDDVAYHLVNAIEKQEKIIIVADYDCDGATACAIGVSGLRAMGANIDFVVPNRFKHGYGLSPSVVDLVKERHDPVWILTVDNGTASHAGIDHANALGIKVLVTDHHLPTDTPPNAVALVNPNQHGCPFPSKALAGCGVIYYVLAAVNQRLKQTGGYKDRTPPKLGEWLDLVALGTVADVVKLDENNRWIVRHGLDRIRQGLVRPGIQALFDVANCKIFSAQSQNFGFAVGPRINAAGRLDDMSVGIQCLLAETYDEALPLATELHELNIKRKSTGNQMEEEAWSIIEAERQSTKLTRVVFEETFHEGVIGIVAGRIKELTNCPTIVFAAAEDVPGHAPMIKGSGRSIEGVHLRDVLDVVHKRDQTLLPKFGGHAMAAGMSIPRDRLDDFKVAFEEAVGHMMNFSSFQKTLETDGDLPTEAMTVETAYYLELEPWGQGFPEPIWTGVFDVLDSHLMGKDKSHLKMVLGRHGQRFGAVQFFNTEEPQTDQVRVAYRLNTNEFRDNVSVQMMVVEKQEVGAPREMEER